jgi:hypothetical protein
VSQTLQTGLGVGLIGKLVVEFGTSCVGVFPTSEAVQVLRSKMNSAKRVFLRGGCLSPQLERRKLRPIGITLCSMQAEEISYLAV